MSTPKLTVLMPVYNSELYLKEAIDSILNQTFTDFEFIIIDDASTDTSVSIVQSYIDSRIQLIQKPKNTGYTNSLNHGLSIAKGEYIARMDSDDISLLTRFEKQITFLDRNKDVVVCGVNYQILGTSTFIKTPEFHQDILIGLLTDSCIGHPTAMLRNEVIKRHHIRYQTSLEPAEDYALWIDLLNYGKLYNLQENLFLYRNHSHQVSTTKKIKQRNSANESRYKILQQLSFTANEQEVFLYKKLFSLQDKFKFHELKPIFLFLNRIQQANNTEYFKKNEFDLFILNKKKFVFEQYFLGNKSYSPKIIIHYFKIVKVVSNRISTFEFCKLVVKSLLFLKYE